MVRVGGASLPGSRYGVLNQDYALVDSFQGCRFALVLDGHGMLGEKAAHHAAMAMAAALKSSALRSEKVDSLAHDTLQALMRDIFIAGHAAVLDLYDTPPQFYNYPLQSPDQKRYALSKHADFQVYTHPTTGPRLLEFGTTATLVLVQGKTVIVAHVGDSLVAIGRRLTSPQGGGDEQTEYDGEFLTKEHNGLDPEERQRLAEYAGKSMIVRAKDGYLSVTSLPPPMGVFSLSMSRALGHQFMSDYGVIPDPVTVVYRVRSEDLVLIAATDGVWEGLNAKAAVQLTVEALSEGRSPDGVAHALCRESIEAVVKSGKSVRADNTSAVVFIFENLDNDGVVENV
jgi:serine/threonine protein phosphatase PrpC